MYIGQKLARNSKYKPKIYQTLSFRRLKHYFNENFNFCAQDGVQGKRIMNPKSLASNFRKVSELTMC